MSSASRFLWVEGPAYTSDTTLAALYVSDKAVEAGILCVSFFGNPQYGGEEAGLVSLLYSMINQLMRLLPSVFETECSFEDEQFELLDGSTNSASTAL